MTPATNQGSHPRPTWVFLLHLALFAGIAPERSLAQDTNVALTVNQQIVTVDEFRFFQQQERAGVLQFARNECGLEDSRELWSRVCRGLTLRARLQQATVIQVVREKVEQQLFKELGLVADISHAAFLRELERINQERTAAQAQGRVIYGPVNFTPWQYFLHCKASRQNEARQLLARERLAVTEAELRAAYQTNATRYTSAPVASWTIITLGPLTPLAIGRAATNISAAAQLAKARLASGETISAVVKHLKTDGQWDVAGEQFEDLSFPRLAEILSDEDAFTELRKFRTGQTGVVESKSGVVRVVKCMGLKPGKPLRFDQVHTQVERQLLASRYAELISAAATNATVHLHQDRIDLIPAD